MEQLLLEKTRAELLAKSKTADIVKSYGTTRYARKDKQQLYNNASSYNKIDMNAFFKVDLLSLEIPVKGEHGNYMVEVFFDGVIEDIRKFVKQNNDVFEYKCVYRAIVGAINRTDIYVHCTCPDFKFRHAYHASKGRYNAGQPQVIPAKVTNPNDTQGAGCKHIMKVLADLNWALSLATCITNYVEYIKEHMPDKYEDIIYPAIHGKAYDPDDDKDLANSMDSEGDKDEINKANAAGKEQPDSDDIDDDEFDNEEEA